MSQININNLSFQYDTHGEDIFKNVSFCIDTDWKLGLIGRNGRGKTTFLKLLMGEYEYSGQIISTVKFEYFPIKGCDIFGTALEVVRNTIAPFTTWEKEMEEYNQLPDKMEEYGEILEKYIDNNGYIINELIEKEVNKIGLDTNILTKTFDILSSGEQTKLLLAGFIFRERIIFYLLMNPQIT